MNAIIPAAVLTQHIAILGKTGSGKTYAAKGIVEGILDDGGRVCIIDPTSVYWGLKSNATGKKGGYAVAVFGGEHADVQIGAAHGEAIAEVIGRSSTPSIIDTSSLRVGERTRFFTDFANTILQKNVGPLHLVIDEAHLFAPQGRVADPQSGNMLHATNNLVSLGRSRGLRIIMISQRPAKLHKDSLTQVETMIAMRLIAPQDRAAVEAWITDQADIQKGKEIIKSLPSLTTGHGWMWAPENNILKRITFPKIKTFDSGKAPTYGDKSVGPVLAPIDLEAIQTKLEVVAKDVIANDPTRMKRQISELEAKLKAMKPTDDTQEIERASYIKGKIEGHKDGIKSVSEEIELLIKICAKDMIERINSAAYVSVMLSATEIKEKIERKFSTHVFPNGSRVKHMGDSYVASFSGSNAQSNKPLTPESSGSSIPESNTKTKPKERLLRSLEFWSANGHDMPTREQVAGIAGYSLGGNFNNILSELRRDGQIDSRTPGTISLSRPFVDGTLIMSAEEAKSMLLNKLTGPQKKIIDAFISEKLLRDTDQMSREEIAQRSNYSVGGNFNNIISQLSTICIIEKAGHDMFKLSDWAVSLLVKS